MRPLPIKFQTLCFTCRCSNVIIWPQSAIGSPLRSQVIADKQLAVLKVSRTTSCPNFQLTYVSLTRHTSRGIKHQMAMILDCIL